MTTLQQQLKAQGHQTINTKTDELDQAFASIQKVAAFVKANTGEDISKEHLAIMTGIQDDLHMALQGMHMEMSEEA